MKSIIAYFISNPSSIEIFIFGALMLSLWFAEFLMLAMPVGVKLKHTGTNLLFILTALPIQLFITIFLLMESATMMKNHWGLLNRMPFHNTFFVKYILGFLLLDFCEYIYHIIMHKTKPLWNFHLVHHSDQKMDVSTTVREHPGETVVRMLFLLLWVALLGASLPLLLLRQTFQTITNVTSHTQFRLNGVSAKILGWVFVTPNLHHVHHHHQLPYTDCNYGDVLIIWDRLFGTYGELDIKDTVFGIDTHPDSEVCKNFVEIIKIPFVPKTHS